MNLEFYHAKIAILSSVFSKATSTFDLLKIGLNSKRVINDRNRKYTFSDVSVVDVGQGEELRSYFYGRLVKFDDIGEETINVELNKTEEQLVEDKIIAKCHFVIDLKENILLYTEIQNHINSRSFIKVFTELLDTGLAETGFSVEVNAINDIYTFLNSLESLVKIDFLKLTAFPTNPFPAEIIKEMDDKLKGQHAKSKTTTYKAKPEGLVIDEEIKKESIYIDIGYGYGEAHGIDKKGQPKKIYSKKTKKQRKTKPIPFTGVNSLIADIDKLFKNENK